MRLTCKNCSFRFVGHNEEFLTRFYCPVCCVKDWEVIKL
jgi:hypothetical protein